MLPYMFGSATQAEIDAATDIETDLNLREMPIAVQFPDWIHWIPRTHPMQIWGDAGMETNWFNVKSERFPSWNNPYQSLEREDQSDASKMPLRNSAALRTAKCLFVLPQYV